MSLNVPAVMVLTASGRSPLHSLAERRRASGVSFARRGAELPVALGGLGIRRPTYHALPGIAEGGARAGLRYVEGAPGAPQHVSSERWRRISQGHLDGVTLPKGWAMGEGLAHARTIGLRRYVLRFSRCVERGFPPTITRWASGSAPPSVTPRPGRVGRMRRADPAPCVGLLPPDNGHAPEQPAGAILAQSTASSAVAACLQRRAETQLRTDRGAGPQSPFRPRHSGAAAVRQRKDKTVMLKADGGKAPLTGW